MDFTESEHSNISISPWNGKHWVIMREINGIYFSTHIVYGTKRFVVIAFIKQFHLIRWATSSNYHILMFFTKLTRIKETRSIRYLNSIPIQSLIQLAFTRLPLLQLITVSPWSSQQIHPAVINPISTDIWTKYALKWLAISDIPSNQSLIPPSRVHQVLILLISVEFGTVDSVSVTVIRSIWLLQLHHFLSLHLIVNTDYRLTSRSHKFSTIIGVVQTIELLISRSRIIFQCGQTFTGC